MSGSAIVLGARPMSGNIGAAIASHLRGRGWLVTEDDCYDGVEYAIPTRDLGVYEACVITLGLTKLTPMRLASQEDIRDVISGTLALPLEGVRRYVQDRGTNGKIVLIGSYGHNHVLTNCAAYCAAKAGLDHAVRELGWELTPDFYTHIIHPYHVPSTPMGKEVVEGMMEHRGMSRSEAEEYQQKDLRLNRHLRPSDIAKVVAWLLSATSPSAWLSGQGFNLYGGVR